eukprot:COSAG01_NODE_35009_length_538_cov_1.665148_1_plen_76_part_01
MGLGAHVGKPCMVNLGDGPYLPGAPGYRLLEEYCHRSETIYFESASKTCKIAILMDRAQAKVQVLLAPLLRQNRTN